jgi:hypothetical protein
MEIFYDKFSEEMNRTNVSRVCRRDRSFGVFISLNPEFQETLGRTPQLYVGDAGRRKERLYDFCVYEGDKRFIRLLLYPL